MTTRLATTALLSLLVLGPASAQAGSVDETRFRYTRAVAVPGTAHPIVFEPDARLYAHSRPGFPDLRVVDARGRAVPWRTLPPRATRARPVRVLNTGTQQGAAVALLDFGRARSVRDRIVLDVLPETRFVARVEAFGSDDRRTFTTLSTSLIYDVAGAESRARSTVVAFPANDYRFIQLRARGIRRIAHATVIARSERPAMLAWRATTTTQQEGRRTRVVADLGFARLPVDDVVVTAEAREYERPFTLEGSADGETWAVVAQGRLFRFRGAQTPPVVFSGRFRSLRLTVENGDDPPLPGLRVVPRRQSRALVLEEGHEPPLRLFYGNARVGAPSYEFARLPFDRLTGRASGRLGAERLNAAFEPGPDTRTFFERNDWVVEVALVLVALAVAAAGLLTMRQRT